MTEIRKVYGDTSSGQVHARITEAQGGDALPPLVCLHPAPSSGLYFQTVLPMLSDGRQVIAPDYPGYGGSDRLSGPPTIEDYATAMLELLDDLGIDRPVDVLGFHTGCLVGSEMALARPDSIRRLVLCDVPYFAAEARAGLKQKMAVPLPISPELTSIESAWSFNVAGRVDDVPLERCIELLAEHLRAGNRDYFGFDAAFSYACEDKLPGVSVDTTVLATQSGLHATSLAAAEAIPGATLVDVTEVTAAVFEAGADAISQRINAALA